MRLFIAFRLNLASEYDLMLSELHRQSFYDSINWVDNDLHHLTVRFIGKTPSCQVDNIVESLKKIASHTSCIDLEINKLGVFGSHYAPRVLWLGVNTNPLLENLYKEINTELLQLGFQLPRENFVPHISLGNIKKIDNKKRFWKMVEEHQNIYHQQFHFTQISLIRSQLEKSGPIYTTLCDIPLLGDTPQNEK